MSIKNSEANLRRWKNPEYRENISKKVSKTLTGKKPSASTKLKQKLVNTNRHKLKGVKRKKEVIEKMKIINKGIKCPNCKMFELIKIPDFDKLDTDVGWRICNWLKVEVYGNPINDNKLIKNFIPKIKKADYYCDNCSCLVKTKNNKKTLINKKFIVVAVSGYFDPLHRGHCEYFKKAKELAGKNGKVICILNNDKQALLKKPKVFMKQEEKRKILESIKYIDEVYISIDRDESVCKSLLAICPDIFAKGGDRYSYEIPELQICNDLNIKIVDGLGKKIQASSELIKKWNEK